MNDILANFSTFFGSNFARPAVQGFVQTAGARVLAAAGNEVKGIIADERQNGEPGRTEEQIIDDIDGRIWHNARHYIGAGVDILRHQPAMDDPIRALITETLNAESADYAAKNPSAPPQEGQVTENQSLQENQPL